jgi:glyoxylase-like metal-dependent hydrolase (beta-lactamase superfamily II)
VSAAALEYPVAAAPETGQAVPLAAGVTWVRLPVPGALRHINVWLLDDGAGLALVDTGMDVPAARAAWDGPLAAVLGGRPLTRIICTHHHPDHAGLAAWLAARHGVAVYMSEPEERLLRVLLGGGANSELEAARIVAFERDGLLVTDEMRPVAAVAGYRRIMSGIPADIRRLADGEVLEIGAIRWQARLVRGHTDGQLVLHSAGAGLLIAGDQVLPRITSNIGIYPERHDPDPLGSFLDSFAGLAALEPEPLVLPSHGDVFRGLRARLDQLRAHHARTLDEVVALVLAPSTAAEVAGRLFRAPLDPLNRMLAVGETLAHLHYLAARGRLSVEERPGEPRRYGPLRTV